MKKSVLAIPAAVMILSVIGSTGCGTNGTATNPVNQTSAASSAQPAGFPVTVKDDTDHAVTIAKRPTRIASTTEGTDEILSALVPKDNIVLVTTYASDPNFSNITSFVKEIHAVQDASAEQIIGVQPDLVLLASYTKQGVVSEVQQAHIPAYEFNDFNSISDIERNIKVVGTLVGNETAAVTLVQEMDRQFEAVKNAVKDQKKVSVLDYSSYGYAAGAATTVNDVIVDAGGVNAAGKLQGWQKVTDEEVVKLNPDVIIDSSDDKGFIEKILSNPALRTVPAVKNHRVYSVKGPDLSSVSQYVTRGVRDIANLLYPSAQIGQ